MSMTIVAVDPSMSSGERADECGIVVVTRKADRKGVQHFYLREDLSGRMPPDKWVAVVVDACERWDTDIVVAEKNQGGDLVEMVIRKANPNLRVKPVKAVQGKFKRAEPIALLCRQGRVHLIGSYPKLERQLLGFDPYAMVGSPDRADAFVWGITYLSEKDDGLGYIEYLKQKCSDAAELVKVGIDHVRTGVAPVLSGPPPAPPMPAGMACPNCGGSLVQQMCGQQGFRCGSGCGHQWGASVESPYTKGVARSPLAQQDDFVPKHWQKFVGR